MFSRPHTHVEQPALEDAVHATASTFISAAAHVAHVLHVVASALKVSPSVQAWHCVSTVDVHAAVRVSSAPHSVHGMHGVPESPSTSHSAPAEHGVQVSDAAVLRVSFPGPQALHAVSTVALQFVSSNWSAEQTVHGVH